MERFIRATESGLAEIRQIECEDAGEDCDKCKYNSVLGCKFIYAARALMAIIEPGEALDITPDLALPAESDYAPELDCSLEQNRVDKDMCADLDAEYERGRR